jgi:hypothetical protein
MIQSTPHKITVVFANETDGHLYVHVEPGSRGLDVAGPVLVDLFSGEAHFRMRCKGRGVQGNALVLLLVPTDPKMTSLGRIVSALGGPRPAEAYIQRVVDTS